MLTKITIHNFQCHRDLVLELGRSTMLQGGSNHGKTSVLRALYWVLYNEAPHDFVSYWAQKKSKKGLSFKDDAYTSVIVEVDGHVIERRRSNDFNGYIVDGTTYEALGTDVPEQVTKIFNLSDASVQQQFDGPFLLSDTAGNASKYLNNLAGLGCVDDILSIAKRKVADTSSTLNGIVADVESLEKEVGSYGWVESAEDLLSKANAEQPMIDGLSRKVEALSRLISDYKAIPKYPEIPTWLVEGDRSGRIARTTATIGALETYIGTLKELGRITPVLERLSKLKEPVSPRHTERDLLSLTRSVREYWSADSTDVRLGNALWVLSRLTEPKPCKWEGKLVPLQRTIREYVSADRACSGVTGALDRLSRLEEPPVCKWTERDSVALMRSIREYGSATRTVAECDNGLKEAYGSLEGVACPVCGRPMSRDTCLL